MREPLLEQAISESEAQVEAPATKDQSLIEGASFPSKVCSRCYLAVDSRALVCGHCQFALAHYEENLARRSFCSMRKVQVAQAGYWLSRYSSHLGDKAGVRLLTAIVAAIVGAVLLLIPVIGWLIGGFLLMGAFWQLLMMFAAPVTSVFSTFSSAEQSVKKNKIENTYTDVSCPACLGALASGKRRTILFWPNAKNSTARCRHCKQTSYRFGDKLLWVPHPQVSATGKLDEFLSNENQTARISATKKLLP